MLQSLVAATKASTEDYDSSTIVDDSELILPLGVGQYAIIGYVELQCAVTTADGKFTFALPANSQNRYRLMMDGDSPDISIFESKALTDTRNVQLGPLTTELGTIQIYGSITATAPGNLQARFGQVVTDAVNPLRVMKGSWLGAWLIS